MRIEEDQNSAEMERLRVRRLWRAFAGGSDPGGPRSTLGRGLLASLVIALLVVIGTFVAGVIEATASSNVEGAATPSSQPAPPATTTAAPTTTPQPAPTTPPPTTAPPTTAPAAPPPERVDVVVPATEWWTDTGVDIAEGDVLRIEATGTITAAVGDPRTEVGPDGSPNPEFTRANRDEHGVQVGGGHGALIGTLSRDFPPFLIGASNTIEFERDGHLFLSVNDGGLDNNAGEFNVNLTIQRKREL
jgi:hypothetical protein